MIDLREFFLKVVIVHYKSFDFLGYIQHRKDFLCKINYLQTVSISVSEESDMQIQYHGSITLLNLWLN